MKQAILFAVCFTATCSIFARTPVPAANYPIDSTRKPARTIHKNDIPSLDIMLTEIIQTTGLQTSFELQPADVRNIEAIISHKKRIIRYNPDFIEWINNATRDKWSSLFLLAHEIGHHLNGHTMHKGGSKPALELEADEYAGFVLNQLGATLEEAQEVMFYIAGEKSSKTHPARLARMNAIREGWVRSSQESVVGSH